MTNTRKILIVDDDSELREALFEQLALLGVRLLTRNGYDWTGHFPRIAAGAETLRRGPF
jgi:CheY-like chemotaxis protein